MTRGERMSIKLNAVAAAATVTVLALMAGGASAQPEYGYGQLPPPPYAYSGGYGEATPSSCGGGDGFTLLGAHAGVTVLGVDLGASAHLGVPAGSACEAPPPAFTPRPYAPPQYAPTGYAEQGEEFQGGYGQQGYPEGEGYAPPPRGWGYQDPCGCVAPPRW